MEFMSVAAPQPNSSQNHKENQGKDQQDWEEVAVADDRSTVHTPTGPPLVTQRRSPARVTVAVMIVVAQPVSIALGLALISSEERCIAAFSIKANRVIATLGARHDQSRVQSVALPLLVPQPRLVHMRSHTMDLRVAHTDGGFYANSVVLNGLGG